MHLEEYAVLDNIPNKPARYGIKFWCLVDVNLGLDIIKLSRLLFIFYLTSLRLFD
jgi:hypothetical protein